MRGRGRSALAAAWMFVLWPLGAALLGCGGALPTPERAVGFRSEARKVVLPNGVRIVVLGDRTTNLVELGVHVAVGSAADPPGKGGLAHLVEHVLFEIAPAGRPIGAELDSVAIDHNAFTTWDSTHYRSAARADQLERLIEIEGRRLAAGCRGLDDAVLAREREVVQNELRLRQGSTAVAIAEQVQELIYTPRHPYGRPIGGDATQVARLGVGDVCGFVARHYVPDRVTVAVSGNVDVADAIRLVTRHFGGLVARSAASLPPVAPPAPLGHLVRRAIPGRTPHLVVAWILPPAGTSRYSAALAAVKALAAALGRGEVVVLGGRSAPVAALWMSGARAARPDETIERIRSLIAFRDFPARVLAARALNRMAIEQLEEFDNLATRVSALAEAVSDGSEADHFARRLADLGRMESRVRAAGYRVLGPSSVVVFEPGAATPQTQYRGAVAAGFKSRTHAEREAQSGVDPGEAGRPLALPLLIPRPGRTERFRLPNGLEVVMRAAGEAPLVEARLVFRAGTAADPPGGGGTAARTAAALQFSTVDSDEADDLPVLKALALFGDEFGGYVTADSTVFTGQGLSSHVDLVLAGLAGLVVRGTIDERFAPRLAPGDGDAMASEKYRHQVDAVVFGADHPYARAPSMARSVERKDLQTFRRRHYTASNGVLILTGRFDPVLTRRYVEHWFRELPRGEPHGEARPRAHVPDGAALVAVAHSGADPQALLEVIFTTPAAAREVGARRVLGEMLAIRARRLRSELAATYDVRAEYEQRLGPGFHRITAVLDGSRTGEAVHALLSALDGLRQGDDDVASDFVLARRRALATVVAHQSGARATAQRLAQLVARRQPLDQEPTLAREIAALTLADVMRVIASDLARERAVIGIHGNTASIAAARAAAEQ